MSDKNWCISFSPMTLGRSHFPMGKSVTPGEKTYGLRFSPDLGLAKTEPFYVKVKQ
jgi:hypothetical protein